MEPSGAYASTIDSSDSDELKPLTEDGSELESGSSANTEQRSLYCLARVDSETGLPQRPVTPMEAEEVARALLGEGDEDFESGSLSSLPPFRCQSGDYGGPKGLLKAGSLKSCGSSSQISKPGGPCGHCGASESPQWRRGPPAKPVLCNACGTRYRRTNQLSPLLHTAAAALRGSAVLARKRCNSAPEKERAVKEPRLVPCQ